jgi:hypothetical protein
MAESTCPVRLAPGKRDIRTEIPHPAQAYDYWLRGYYAIERGQAVVRG